MSRRVLVVGDVINDIVVQPLGPTAVGTDTASRVEYSPGGSGANQAAWLGWLGAAVSFAGRAGASDCAAHRLALEVLGVEAHIADDPERPTGTIVVLVGADGERSMFTDRGANAALASSDLPATLLRDAALLHLSGYQLFEPGTRDALEALRQAARRDRVALSVDPASVAGLARLGAEAFLEWTAGARFVFPNEDEGALLTGERKPERIAAALLERYEAVALKLGPAGALVAERGSAPVRVEAAPARVLDSTGAGDAFCAGFLSAWLRGAELAACGQDAARTAALALGRLGARPPAR